MVAGLACLTLTSCNDFLDTVPDTRVYLSNVEQLQKLLVDGYMSNDYSLIGELSSDNMVDNTAPDKSGMRYNLTPYEQFDDQVFAWEDVTLSTSSDSPYSVWNACYSAIAVANAVLEKADQFEADGKTPEAPLTDDDRAKLKAVRGEALLIRAFHHFVLANIFCMPYGGNNAANQLGLPYMTHPETEVKPEYERGNLKDFYENIEKDLQAGLELVTDQYYKIPRYHFNRTAANAFAARFYLWIRDYKKAKEYADIALGADPASNMNTLWRRDDLYSSEDHVRANSELTNPSIMMSISTYSVWSRRPGSRYGCKDNAMGATVSGPGPTWTGSHPCFRNMLFISGSQDYGVMFFANWGELFEYTDKLAGIGYVHMMRNEFTIEETLLVRAEAEIFLSENEPAMLDAAVADLKMWIDNRDDCVNKSNVKTELTAGRIERFYTGKPGFEIIKDMHIDEVCPVNNYHVTEQMVPYLQCVQHFRRIETIHKGNRWFDIKRYGIEIEHRIGASRVERLTLNDPRRAVQVPYEVWISGMEKNPRNETPVNKPVDPDTYQLAQ